MSRASLEIARPTSSPTRSRQSIAAMGTPGDIPAVTVTVTADATPFTPGAWTEMIASSSTIVDFVVIQVTGVAVNGADTAMLLDVAVGGAAAEVAVVSSIPVGGASGLVYTLPLRVLKGERISVRIAATITVDTAVVHLSTIAAVPGYSSPRFLLTFGANTGAARGVNMPSTNTWVEVTAATTVPLCGLIPMLALAGSTGVAQETVLLDAGVGAAGAEAVVASGRYWETTSEVITNMSQSTNFAAAPAVVVARHIPAGTRLAARQSTGRTYRDAIIIGVPYS